MPTLYAPYVLLHKTFFASLSILKVPYFLAIERNGENLSKIMFIVRGYYDLKVLTQNKTCIFFGLMPKFMAKRQSLFFCFSIYRLKRNRGYLFNFAKDCI